MTLIRLSSLCVLLAITSCAAQPRIIQVPVTLPVVAHPTLEAVPPSAFKCPPGVSLPPGWMCLSNATYSVLVARENALRQWGLQQHAVVDANNVRAKAATPPR